VDPKRWERVEEIFGAALEQPLAARPHTVAEACGDDEELRDEVLSLLESADSAGDYFSELASRAGVAPAAEIDPDRFVGRTIGRYRLVRPLGRGGMGIVFLAARDDRQFEKEVALKLLPIGLGAGEGLQRFLRERQILARLEHPGIARLLDGGVTDDGTPYYVMEYVDGAPIDRYCDDRHLAIQARLDLFLQVCDAVEHAHRHLVVHRDLKPGNILVGEDGSVKLLDFGIARVLDDGDADGESTLTRRMRPMTLAWASPEQVRGEPITTASDVYALGILLYRLLTGLHPYRRDFTSPSDAERVICEEEPTQPSARLDAADAAEGNAIGEARGSSVQRLRSDLAGDLDAIVLMALRKEAERRYASVSHLADDLRRYRKGLPVHAHRDSIGYRVSRFVRRNRLAVAATVAVLTMLLAFVALAIRYGVSTAAHGRALAAEAANTQDVMDFLMGLFQTADPVQGFGDTVRARALLDEGAARLAATDARPDVRARMMNSLARVYYNLGLFDDAVALHRDALAVQRDLYGDAHPEIAETLTLLADALHGMREFEQAEPVYHDAIAVHRRIGTDPLEVAVTLQGLARVERELDRADSARALLGEVLAIRRDALGDEHFQTAWAELDVAYALRGEGKLDSAKALYEAVIPKLEAHGDSGMRLLPSAVNNLAYLHMRQDDLPGAEALYREAIALEREWGTMANVLLLYNNLAGVLDRMGDTAGTEATLRDGIREAERYWPEGDAQVGFKYGGLGAWYVSRGLPDSAEAPLRRALSEFAAAFGDGHSRTTYAKVQLATCLTRQRRYAEAEAYLVQAFAWLRDNRGMGNSYTREVGVQLVALYDAWNRPARAAAYRRILSEAPAGG
jgi:serine/threonine protein kinase/tetratricopeptide (TPR) repeat protein